MTCQWCNAHKDNPYGMCGSCGRFPNLRGMNMVTITCESVDCGRELATAPDYDEAAEIALYDNGHNYHSEAGVWTCAACVQDEWVSMAAEMPVYEAELAMRAQLDREDEWITQLEMAADAYRGN